MQPIRVCLPLIVLASLAFQLAVPATAADANKKIEVKSVDFKTLAEAVKKHRGKVVVVDFWADYCLACKEEFPNLVKLHKQYGPDKLVAISVSLDDPTDKKAAARVHKFLTKSGATFENYLLNEKEDVWKAKLDIEGPPSIFLYNQEGKLEKKHWDYDEIRDQVKKLLEKK